MENSEFAKIFWEIAEFLELKEENPFKIRAYRKAAQNIEALSEDIESVYKKGGLEALEAVPGVGEHIAEKIEQIIKTGKLELHQKLIKEFPKGFIELMNTPGLGPKTALLLYKKLKIDSREKLEKAAQAGKLRGLPGMGAKKEENILKGIELKKKVTGRFLLNDAWKHADNIMSSLEKLKEIKEIMPAGSLRRWKETIGDIDILVIAEKSERIMDTFTKLPQVSRVLAKGPTKSSIVLKDGMQADLRVLEPKSFGAALHYFTGSKQHNIQVRTLGVKKGLKISEYGIFKKNKYIGGKTEEEVFKAVGLPWIPPEMREGTGEIEAAQKGKLPKLVELKDIRGDLQMHSKWSDGGNTIEQMAEYAKKLSYEYIAITDHSKAVRVAGGMDEKEVLKQLKEIDKVNHKFKGIRILKGIEVDILADGSLDLPDRILKELDVVVAAVHSRFKMPKDEMTKRIISAFKNKYVNILSHPTGRIIGRRDPYEVDMEKIIKAAEDTGTYLEINSYPERLDLSDIHARRAKEEGVLIAIDTDAHAAIQLDIMKYGVATARRGWLEKKDVINTQPLAKLLKLLYAKR
ncbi:DNA polymerase III [candidate division WOR-1 bacterium DG_54_3]|uniref:DNA polymerase beta n=1 Tax=candidate division WOR-1 bacterium DG_54_3 TaxID=1703775 RepID=A0A0S7XR14_UNCSA|nr:MAG: DNA polymerase III [candidate division WOR-1 bacterium DG_54_3]